MNNNSITNSESIVRSLNDTEYLAIGKDGNYETKKKYKSSDAQLDRLVAFVKNENFDEIDIYFHGGLVTETLAESAISGMKSSFNFPQPNGRHLIGVIWNTDVKSTIEDNLSSIFDKYFAKTVMRWVLRSVGRKLKTKNVLTKQLDFTFEQVESEWESVRTSGTSPFYELEPFLQSAAETLTENDIPEEDEELVNDIVKEMEKRYEQVDPVEEWGVIDSNIMPNQELLDAFPITNEKGQLIFGWFRIARAIVKVAARTLYRYMKKNDHGLQQTLVEELCRTYYIGNLGQWAWKEMKIRAEKMWDGPGKGGYELMERLNKDCPNIKINIIGHSAGSICNLHLLNKYREMSWLFKIKNIAWLAPACKIELFKTALIDHTDSFDSFRTFTMTDKYELEDILLDYDYMRWIYPSSLLYFISGVLERRSDYPLAGMMRYYSGKSPYRTKDILAAKAYMDNAGHIATSPSSSTASKGMQTHCFDHGYFDNELITLASVNFFFSKE